MIKDEYFPPEILQNSGLNMSITKSNGDIWMLGIILYKLVFGVFPYSGTKEQILNKINAKEKD